LSRDAFVRYARRECGAFSAWQFGGTGVSDAVTEFLVREMNAKERIGRRELNSWRILNLAFFTFGKKADILRCGSNVCFTPQAGIGRCILGHPRDIPPIAVLANNPLGLYCTNLINAIFQSWNRIQPKPIS
jgi:hypothetical protein